MSIGTTEISKTRASIKRLLKASFSENSGKGNKLKLILWLIIFCLSLNHSQIIQKNLAFAMDGRERKSSY